MNLEDLRVEGGVRIRGEAVTRLETFVDAAFAFAVTLLVVSFDAMPRSFAELYEALRRLPAFLAGFAIIAMFWSAHHRYSRRFGFEDAWIAFLSLALVAGTLFYVYPLRMVMAAFMSYATQGWAPSEMAVESMLEFRLVWIIYGVGFGVLAAVIALMNVHALRHAVSLRLDAAERAAARAEIVFMSVIIGSALLSMALALLIPEGRRWTASLPGFAYALLALIMPWYGTRSSRQIAALAAQRRQASSA